MASIPSGRQSIVIVIGAIIIAILGTSLAMLFGLENMIIWLMLDTACTLLLIGLKGENE